MFWDSKTVRVSKLTPVAKYMKFVHEASGVVTGGIRGQSAAPDSEKITKNREKQEKIRKNRKEKVKIGKVLSLCPSWQIGLATLLKHRFNGSLFVCLSMLVRGDTCLVHDKLIAPTVCLLYIRISVNEIEPCLADLFSLLLPRLIFTSNKTFYS